MVGLVAAEISRESGGSFDALGVHIDPARHEVRVQGRRVQFTATQFRLLRLLATHAGVVFGRKQLIADLFGGAVGKRTIDSHIRAIRRKLGPRRTLIETIRGVGYRFVEIEPASHLAGLTRPGRRLPVDRHLGRGELTKAARLALPIVAPLPVGLCYLDADLRYQMVNEWLAQLNGVSVDEHLGRTLAEVVPHVAAYVEPVFRRLFKTGEPVVDAIVEAVTSGEPGTKRVFQHCYYPIRRAGQVVGVSGVVLEISARRAPVASISWSSIHLTPSSRAHGRESIEP